MFILKSKDSDLVLNQEEASQVMKALNESKKFIMVKGQMIQSAFVSGVYPLEDQVVQEKARLSEKNKWKCWKCGLVYSYEQQSYCYCNKRDFEFLKKEEQYLLNN